MATRRSRRCWRVRIPSMEAVYGSAMGAVVLSFQVVDVISCGVDTRLERAARVGGTRFTVFRPFRWLLVAVMVVYFYEREVEVFRGTFAPLVGCKMKAGRSSLALEKASRIRRRMQET